VLSNISHNKIKHFSLGALLLLTAFLINLGINFSELAKESRIELLKNETCNTQIQVYAKDSNKSHFSLLGLDKDVADIPGVLYAVPKLGGLGYDVQHASEIYITGVELGVQDSVFTFSFIEGSAADLSAADGVVITEEYAKKYTISLGDNIELRADSAMEFRVVGICRLNNQIVYENDMIVQRAAAEELFDAEGLASYIGITIADLSQIDVVQGLVNEKIPADLISKTSYDASNYDAIVTAISATLLILVVVSIAIEMFLCYTVFRNFIYERQRQIASTLSLGLKRSNIIFQYLLEYMAIAIPASAIGFALALPAMSTLLQVAVGFNVSLSVSRMIFPGLVVLLFVMLNQLPVLGFVAHKASKGILALIKGDSITSLQSRWGSIVANIGLLCIGAITYVLYIQTNNIVYLGISGFCVASFLVITAVFLAKLLLEIVNYLAVFLLKRNNVLLATLIHNTKNSNYNIILLIAATALVALSLQTAQIISYNTNIVYKYTDIRVTVFDILTNDNIDDLIMNREDVRQGVKIDKSIARVNGDEITIFGISPSEYASISSEDTANLSSAECFGKLDSEGSVILTQTIATKHGLKIGDTMTFSSEGKPCTLKIVATVRSFEDMGRVAFVSKAEFQKNFEVSYTTYLITLQDASRAYAVSDMIKTSLSEKAYYSVNPVEELQAMAAQSNSVVFVIVYLVIGLVLAVTAIGLVSNITLNILSRRRDYAVMGVLGLTFRNIAAAHILEGVYWGLVGGLTGVLLGTVLVRYIVLLLEGYVGSIALNNSATSLMPAILVLLLCIMIYLICTLFQKKSNDVVYLRGAE
jgi:ABC-type lipoprotein release transport system permease subunit